MGYDRQFYTDTKEGFSPCKSVGFEGGKYIYSCSFTLPAEGFYYLQYTLDRDTEVTVYSHKSHYTPMIHGEDMEVRVFLSGGENTIILSLEKERDFMVRLFDEDGSLIVQDGYKEDCHIENAKASPSPSKAAFEGLLDAPTVEYPSGEIYEKFSMPDGLSGGLGADILGYGRFGFAKGDGLLDYSMAGFGIITRPFITGHPRYKERFMWSFSLLPDGEVESGALTAWNAYIPPENESIKVDWTHTEWERQLTDGHFIKYDYSTITPSLLIETDLNYIKMSRLHKLGVYKCATIPLSGGVLTRRQSDGILYDRERDGELRENFILLSGQGKFPEVPILLTLPRSPRKVFTDRDSVTVLFDGAASEMQLTFPYGIELFDPDDLDEDFYREAVKKAAVDYRLTLARPVKCEEYYKIEGERVKIYDKFSFRRMKDSTDTPPIFAATLPPPVALAASEVKEISFDNRSSLSHPTKYGPLLRVLGTDHTYYELPIPEYREKLPICEENRAEYRALLHSDFDNYLHYHTDVDEIPTPGGYGFVYQYAIVAKLFSFLDEEDRKKLEEQLRFGVSVVCNPDYAYIGPKGKRCLSWYKRTEPYSGLTFYSTYLHVSGINYFTHCDREVIENSDRPFIEIDWGNGMTLYGLWLGAMLSGKLDYVSEHFDVIKRAFDYFLVGMDFACMCVGYAENATLWNDGAGYGAFLGFINLADALGKKDELEVGLYAYAKMCCLRQAMFVSSQKYFAKYYGTEPWYITKFFHEETDGSHTFTSYPRDVIRCDYRTEGLYNLTTEGHYKEAMRMYAEYLRGEVGNLLSAAEGSMLVPITGPTDWKVQYVAAGRRGILSTQETYTYLLLSAYTERFGIDELYRMMNEAADNGRIAKEMIGAEFSHRRVPREWAKVMLLSEIDSFGKPSLTAWRGVKVYTVKSSLRLESVDDGAWIEFYSEKPPKAELDGEILPTVKLRKNIYRIDLTRGGNLTLN